MTTTPLYYFTGKEAYMLAYMEYFMEAAGAGWAISELRNLEVILDSNLEILAMRFDRNEKPGRDAILVANQWVLTEREGFLEEDERQALLAYCELLKEGENGPLSNSADEEDLKYHKKLSGKLRRDMKRMGLSFE